MKPARLFALLLAGVIAFAAWSAVRASELDGPMASPKLEARALAITEQLRCLVCQDESIADSQAPLAHDIRKLVRRRLLAGESDQQIIKFLVSRYGEFVLLKPPFSWNTVALWGAPPFLLLFGIVTVVAVEKRRNAQLVGAGEATLSPAEEARLAEVLGEDTAAR